MSRILLLIATYNERDNLPALIHDIHQHAREVDVLIIDDHSPDGTGEVADQLAQEDSRIRVLHRSGKLGLGTAILTGMRFALEHDYDLFINMDGDFSHHPRYVPALLERAEHVDVAVGSRYVSGGGTKGWPLRRRLMSRGVNLLTRLLLRIPAKDTSSSFRCYRASILPAVVRAKMLSRGYSFQQEALFRCWRAGGRIGEIPICFEDRAAGNSKANLYEMARSLSVLLYLGVRLVFGMDRASLR